jgi:hypothetical protein
MKKLNLIDLVEIQGGTASQVISGLCLATAIGRVAGYFTPAIGVSVGLTIACAINTVGGNQDWW